MSYKYDSSHTSANYTPGRGGNTVDGIVIHHWGVDGQDHDSVVAYLCSPRPENPTSAHYIVSGGRVTCIVDPDDTAYHAGNWAANQTQIGIECRPEMSDEDMATVAELIADLRGTYGNIPLSGHADWSSTCCPGRWGNQLGYLDQIARDLAAAGVGPDAFTVPDPRPTPVPEPDIEDLAQRAAAGEFGNGEDRIGALGDLYDIVQVRVDEILGY